MIQIYSGLWVIGDDLDPEGVVSALGDLHAKAIRRRGELMRNGRPRGQGHVWLTTDDTIRSSIEESLDDLFGRLDPVWPALVDLSLAHEISIECYVKLYDRPPAGDPYLGFEARHVRRAAELQADLGIDLQDYRGSDAEPDHPTG